MSCSWEECSHDVKGFVRNLLKETKAILGAGFVGFYIHGSLAMGGFNPMRSDSDILVVTVRELTIEENKHLAEVLLKTSNEPFPVEISILTVQHLQDWKHPCFYEFHYSEGWRDWYEHALSKGDVQAIADLKGEDPDLAAHLTILINRGICIEGPPISEVFPVVPRSDYISSILYDYEDCLEDIESNPVYCMLNIVRVYWYLHDEVISSKQEAGIWGRTSFPGKIGITIEKAYENYSGLKEHSFERSDLLAVRDYFQPRVTELMRMP
ncbi:aminoglycoside adenylyltransferase domain-containing protein [Alkalihalobacillus sp. R86527]|uniref:aminoglycoside adenylyltransferase domain-containing protein n=1 Tax=Alkalihalobacillus sp. R86527 TaxID=3093863 RepID=UPI00366BAF3E